jgi:hypothetical protein
MSSAASLGPATAGSERGDNPLSDLERLQLQQAAETYRAQLSLMVQILTILVVADITLVGYAITAKSAAIVAIGTAFPLGMLYISWAVFKLSIPFFFIAVKIELNSGVQGLFSTFLAFVQTPTYLSELRDIAASGTFQEQIAKLRKMKIPSVRAGKLHGRILMFGVAAAQIMAALAVHYWIGWGWFGK